jgi:putative transposase
MPWLMPPIPSRWRHSGPTSPSRRVFAQPKPKWVQQDIIRLKALMPQAGCRTIAHHFNRRWTHRRQMTVSKTYVADTCRRHQYLILTARRKLKHSMPRPMPRNRVWGCDLLVKTDANGQPHLALAILDHASRACLRLQRLSDKSSRTLLRELVHTVKQHGRPQFLRTDNEAVLVSWLFRFGLWLLGIRQQRIDPGCPWQNGRVERFIGTVKRELKQKPLTSDKDFDRTLTSIRRWYNHDRPHDHLQGRTPAEVWAGVDVFAAKPG